jgi:hypothetical protein
MNIQYVVIGRLSWNDYPNDSNDWSNCTPDIFDNINTKEEAITKKEQLIEKYKSSKYYETAQDPKKHYEVNIIAYIRELSDCDISDVIY